MALIVFIISIVALLLLIYVSIRLPSKHKGAKRLRLIFILIAFLTVVISGFIWFAPRGKNPLYGKAGIGSDTGLDSKQTYADSSDNVEVETGEGLVIRIQGDKVSAGSREFQTGRDGNNEFEEYISSLNPDGKEIKLIDAYAFLAPYNYVKNLLMDNNAVIVEVRED